ncbi:hypothetical protein PbB2_02508 [Candidatus Phycosocius bacilliformis]|uniref:Putative Flp pilus-assembly TadG-like N-terminal domain-containing protein n=1 Tax=Candidatus Phycosocius bacilliformis TaxID=1445552 RepID=A0A2P2ECN6_9PROT|nr:pilus assembly protein TadG-related protein [Candidatus Phycosocius bacilliformis]GBF58820.1 hypothetical protein PbB2_02508 [Candidatus Phycosocius bacilliformis]
MRVWPPKQQSKRCARDGRGNIAVTAAILLIPLSMGIAIASELISVSGERALMQSAADAAALSGAQNLILVGSQQRQSTSDAEAFAMAQVGDFATRAAVSFKATQNTDGTYMVEGLAVRPSFFGDLVPPGGFRIEVKAVAESLAVQPLCIIGDDATTGGVAINLANTSSIKATNCIVHSNSDFRLQNSGKVEAGSPRATGVAIGGGFTPAASSGALRIQDPFANRVIAPPQDCSTIADGGQVTLAQGTTTLNPGMHRTEYTVTGQAILSLTPGEYYFCKGLKVAGQGRLVGEDVMLMFTSGNALSANNSASISLSGRRSGQWAGFLLVATRNNYANTSLASGSVDRLLGTIYLPMSRLIVGGQGDVAENSEWSVVVARNINLSSSARLVINTDYIGSPVPVPIGVGNQAGIGNTIPPRLRQ